MVCSTCDALKGSVKLRPFCDDCEDVRILSASVAVVDPCSAFLLLNTDAASRSSADPCCDIEGLEEAAAVNIGSMHCIGIGILF